MPEEGMDAMEFLQNIVKYFQIITFTDILDIAIVTFAVYQLIKLIRETRAETLVKGIVLLLVLLQLSAWLKLNTLNFILENTMQFGIIALLVVFQPELRRALDRMGRSWSSVDLFSSDSDQKRVMIKCAIDQICQAVSMMSASKIGAIIVMERETKLGDVVRTGTVVDAAVTSDLIRNIFYPKSPLHDGAMIIRDGRVHAAGCFLPLSQQEGISKELGTRHRAALGMSESSDALIIVVSEETGRISTACGGMLTRNLTPKSLDTILNKALYPEPVQPVRSKLQRFHFWRKNHDEDK